MNKCTVPYLTSRIYIPYISNTLVRKTRYQYSSSLFHDRCAPLFPVLATTILHLATPGSIR